MKQPDPLFCEIGDQVEFIRAVKPAPTKDGTSTSIAAGSRYKVTRLVGSGWDLELLSGDGPVEVRLLNSQMGEYVKVLSDPSEGKG